MFGNRISLDEIELQLKNNGIKCACVGYDDKLKIFITNKDNEAKLKKILTKKMHINSKVYKIILINFIPTNSSGKIDYKYLENI